MRFLHSSWPARLTLTLMFLVSVWCYCWPGQTAAAAPQHAVPSSAAHACCHNVDGREAVEHRPAPAPCGDCVLVELRQNMLSDRGRSSIAPPVAPALLFTPVVFAPPSFTLHLHPSSGPLEYGPPPSTLLALHSCLLC